MTILFIWDPPGIVSNLTYVGKTYQPRALRVLGRQGIWMVSIILLSEYMNGVGKIFRGRTPVPFYLLN